MVSSRPRWPRSRAGPLPLHRGLLTWVHSPSAVPPARTTPAPLGAAPLQSLQQPPGGDQQPAAVGKRETGAGERGWPQPASSEDSLARHGLGQLLCLAGAPHPRTCTPGCGGRGWAVGPEVPGVLVITCEGFHGLGCPRRAAGLLPGAPAGGG